MHGSLRASSGCRRACASPGKKVQLPEPGMTWPAVCVCTLQSVPATGVQLKPQGYVFSDVSSWRGWDPGTRLGV